MMEVKQGQKAIPGPYLMVSGGSQRGMVIPLDFARLKTKPLTLGRSAAISDVVLQSAHNMVSSRHAIITYRPEDKLLVITDTGSTNGTFVNGDPIAGNTPLYPGDQLVCGDVELFFMVPSMPSPPQRPNRYQIEDSYAGVGRLEVIVSKVNNIRAGAFCRLTPQHPFTIGRHTGNDLRLVEEGELSKLISRYQSGIRWNEGAYIIYDPGATNPSLVNRMPVQGSVRLNDGDQLQIGSTLLRYRSPRKAYLEAAPPAARQDGRVMVLRHDSRLKLHVGPEQLALPAGREIKIGRAKESDLRLQDASVSRHHARIFYTEGRMQLDDAGSANGTFVNGKLIQQPVQIKAGDRLRFGEFEFVLEDAPASTVNSKAVPLLSSFTLQLSLETPENVPQLPAGAATSVISRSMFLPKVEKEARVEDLTGTFEEICERSGTVFSVDGKDTFLLNEPDSAWLIKKGRVEVFAVQLKNGRPVNNRHHICSKITGQGMLSPDSESYGEGLALLAVPYPGTRVIKFPLPKLRALCRSPQHNEEAAGLINDWVASLTDSITGNMASPRGITLLEPGQNVTLKPRDRATSRKGGIWLRMQDGMGLYLGEEEITFPSDEGLFPLFGNSWLSALEETRLAVVTGREAVADPRLWEGLELFHEIFFRMCFTGIRLVTFDEINRLRQKAEYDQQSGQEALYNLSSILPGKTEKFEAELKGGKNVLLAACRLVGESLGIAVQAPADRQGLTAESNMLVEIGRVSRFRTREVTLEPGWWTRDNGPLLGFWKEGIEGKEAGSPVAILPVNARSYRVIDPADNSQYSANKTLAAMLEPTGFVFYRPFPLKTLRALDLIRFGVRGARKDLLSILLLSIAAGLIALFVPAVTAYLFDTVTPSGNQSLVWQVLAGLIVAAISATTFQLTRSIAILRLETRLDNSIQAAIWDRLLELPISFFRKFTVGDLAVRAMGVDAILHLIGSNVIVSILSSIFSVFSFFLLFVYDVRLALVALGLTLFTLAVIIGFSVWELRYQRSLSELQGRVSGQVLQLITGISKLRVAGAETRAFRLWSREFANQRRVAYKARTVNNYQTVFNSVWPLANSILIFFFIDLFHKDQGLTTGVFLAFIAAFGQFLAAMIAMAGAFTAVLQAIPLYERVRVILDEEPEIKAGKIDPGDLSGSIELNHVSFRYSQDTPYILNDVSVSIKPGQFVAIVGPSGSGKSTLLRLILGFETPESGTIYYDNQDLGELDVSAVRRRIGVVMQNGKLMPGDILSNIIGSSLYSVEDAWEAARMAGLEDDIKSFPMGMYTIISEGASTLSGGQRQRLMIARSIIGKPRILLFDEATSALDNQTQAIVSRSLENLQSTRIVIAHRLSTIEKADCIYVLQGGKVAQSGTYEELMSQEGPFKELASRQLV